MLNVISDMNPNVITVMSNVLPLFHHGGYACRFLWCFSYFSLGCVTFFFFVPTWFPVVIWGWEYVDMWRHIRGRPSEEQKRYIREILKYFSARIVTLWSHNDAFHLICERKRREKRASPTGYDTRPSFVHVIYFLLNYCCRLKAHHPMFNGPPLQHQT